MSFAVSRRTFVIGSALLAAVPRAFAQQAFFRIGTGGTSGRMVVSPDAIISAIQQLLRDDELRARMGEGTSEPAPAPPRPPEKPAVKKPDVARAPPTREASTAAKAARAEAQAAGAGTKPGKRPRGGDLGAVMAGIGAQPSKSNSQVPQAATMSAEAAMDIGSKIQQQVQPCASRQRLLAPGVQRIVVSIRLSINRDGSLSADPQVTGHAGLDDDNRRYVEQVDERAIAAFKCAAPLRGLPQELYDVPRGWRTFTLRFHLP